MKKASVLLLLFVAMIGTYASGCSSSDDCVTSCQDKQAKTCTDIPDCQTYCSAIELVTTEAKCEDDLGRYTDCLLNTDVCKGDQQCAIEKKTLISCTDPYCVNHTSEPSCETITQNQL